MPSVSRHGYFYSFYDYDSLTVYSELHAKSQSIIRWFMLDSTDMVPRLLRAREACVSFRVGIAMSLGHLIYMTSQKK